jgi:hypothetical protein
MRTIRILSVMLLSMALTFALVPVAAATGLHAVRGTVRSATGEPIEGAAVAVYGAYVGNWFASVVTGADGTYEIAGLTDGTYDIKAGADGYLHGGFSSNPLIVASAPDIDGVDILLQPGQVITGSVVGALDTPVAWAHVYVYGPDGEVAARVNTNELGQFEASGLLPGDYRVEARDLSLSYLSSYYSGKALFEAADGVAAGTSGLVVRLPQAGTGTIEGRLTGYVDPEAFAFAEAVAVDGSVARNVEADVSTGMFSIDMLPAGDYKVRAWSAAADISYHGGSSPEQATIVHVDESAVVQGADIELARGTAKIAGTVRDAVGYELASARVTVYDLEHLTVGTAQSAADGRFEVTDLPAGKYKVRVTDSSGQFRTMYYASPHDEPVFSEAAVVGLVAGTTFPGARVDLPPRQGGLSGVVTDMGGNPLPGIQATIHDDEGTALVTLSTNAVGVYSYGTLANGTYRVQAQDPEGRFMAAWTGDEATVIQGQSENAEITMANAPVVPSPVLSTRTSLSASRMRVRRGSLVVLTGRLEPRFAGAIVNLQGRDASGHRFVVRRVTDQNGSFRVTVRVFGTMRYRFAYGGDAQHLASVSRTLPIWIFAQ